MKYMKFIGGRVWLTWPVAPFCLPYGGYKNVLFPRVAEKDLFNTATQMAA